MTGLIASITKRRMARPKRFTKPMLVRFEEGTFERIDAVLRPPPDDGTQGEDRTHFIREAVAELLRRREREAKRAAPDKPPPGGPGVRLKKESGNG